MWTPRRRCEPRHSVPTAVDAALDAALTRPDVTATEAANPIPRPKADSAHGVVVDGVFAEVEMSSPEILRSIAVRAAPETARDSDPRVRLAVKPSEPRSGSPSNDAMRVT